MMSSRARWIGVAGVTIVALVSFGMLATRTIRAYGDYAIRSQISEGLNLATPFKFAVADAWRANGQHFASIEAASLRPALPRTGKYVSSVDVVSGAIVITYANEANAVLRGRSLTIVPALNDVREIAWQCGYGAAPPGFEAIFDAPSRLTDVPEEYLPSSCRR